MFHLYNLDTGEFIISRDVKFVGDPILPKSLEPVNLVQEGVEILEDLDILDPTNAWQHKLLDYLLNEKPDMFQQILDGDLETPVDPAYFTEDPAELFRQDEDPDQANVNNTVLSELTEISTSLAEAKRSPDWLHWQDAMDEECKKFEDLGTYILVECEQGMNVLSGKWVFDRKYNKEGKTICFWARWVVQGFMQQKGVDYKKSYAAVVSSATTRTLFAVQAARGWKSKSIDFVSAFLNGTLAEDETVFMELPTGRKRGRGKLVGMLRQSLYGLKQAARAWYYTATNYLKKIGF